MPKIKDLCNFLRICEHLSEKRFRKNFQNNVAYSFNRSVIMSSLMTCSISGRRDELRIMTDLMINMLEPTRTTHLLYRTNLSYSQLKKYLSSLLNMGLIEERIEPYRAFSVTDRGRIFLDIVGAELGQNSGFATTSRYPKVVTGDRKSWLTEITV